jgi:arylsulfatase A-like enzyme
VRENQRIVIYLVDALRSDLGGVDPSSLEVTKIFKDGIVFKNAYSNATQTRDSLPVLFTGMYKFIINKNSQKNPFVYDAYETLTEYLGKKGFTTAAFIANNWPVLSNSSQGFDYIYHHQPRINTEDLSYRSVDISESDYKKITIGQILQEAKAFLKKNLDKPLFIYIHTMETHAPFGVPKAKRQFSSKWKDGILKKIRINTTYFYKLHNPSREEVNIIQDFYKDEVLEMSKNFFTFCKALQKFGIDEKTLLIFTSDHGERLFEHESWGHGEPDIFNEVLRIPLFMKYPGSSSQKVEKNVSHIDIFPTVAAYLHDSKEKEKHIGSNLIDLKNGQEKIIYADGHRNDLFAFFYVKEKLIFDRDKVLYFDLERDKEEKMPKYLEKMDRVGFRNLDIKSLMKLKSDLIAKYYKKGVEFQKRLSPEDIKRLKSLGYLK